MAERDTVVELDDARSRRAAGAGATRGAGSTGAGSTGAGSTGAASTGAGSTGSVASGADRAATERRRRQARPTPLLGVPDRAGSGGAGSGRAGSGGAGSDAHDLGSLAAEAARLGEQIAAGAGNPSQDTGRIEEQVAAALAFCRRRITGDYTVDEFGFDPELTETVLLALLRPLYRTWFRVEVRGAENVPSVGGALVVANHSGTIPLDALMTQVALFDDHPARRHLRTLAADLAFDIPVVAEVARKSGSTLATHPDAERLLRAGHVVGVWPEGFKGIGKPYRDRYKLQRFGRGGFVAAALRTGVPIVPCSIVGAEEIYPVIANLRTIARSLGLPYLPVTPTFPWLGPLGLVPLPSKWLIEFGEPIETGGHGKDAADDPMLVFELTDQVRESIQQNLYSLLLQRRSVFTSGPVFG